MQIAVTGATGFVGRRLVEMAREAGHDVLALTRSAAAARGVLGEAASVREVDPRDPASLAEAIAGTDAVVNLQGENLFARRWNASVRDDLRASRVETTAALVEAMARRGDARPKTLVSASAVGIYGPRPPDEVLDEGAVAAGEAPSDDDFLASVCAAWERAALAAKAGGTRAVLLRIGPVLGPGGGALEAMEGPYRKFVGGPVGSGRQIVSWIHRDDLCRLILFGLEDDGIEGPVNATAPHPVANRELGKALGRALHRPSWAPAPAFMLRLVLGGVAAIVTEGQDVRPRRAEEAGFEFRYPSVDEALAQIYG